MKKIVLSALVITTCMVTAKSQVGINQNTPKASLDVTASLGTSPDGVLVPRLSLGELRTKGDGVYQIPQHGALIYITNASDDAPFGKTVNITKTGFYYYTQTNTNNGIWEPLIKESSNSVNDLQVKYVSDNNYIIKGDEEIILFNAPDGVVNVTVNKDIVPEPAIGKVIHIQSFFEQVEFAGPGLRGDVIKVIYARRTGYLMYVKGIDGNGQWLLKN